MYLNSNKRPSRVGVLKYHLKNNGCYRDTVFKLCLGMLYLNGTSTSDRIRLESEGTTVKENG
jgi:hypothetical protein